jgi:hypothetical protein
MSTSLLFPTTIHSFIRKQKTCDIAQSKHNTAEIYAHNWKEIQTEISAKKLSRAVVFSASIGEPRKFLAFSAHFHARAIDGFSTNFLLTICCMRVNHFMFFSSSLSAKNFSMLTFT